MASSADLGSSIHQLLAEWRELWGSLEEQAAPQFRGVSKGGQSANTMGISSCRVLSLEFQLFSESPEAIITSSASLSLLRS